MAAEVGLLSRNIKIIGGNYDRLFDESFGARIIVARTSDGVNSYSGRFLNLNTVYEITFNVNKLIKFGV